MYSYSILISTFCLAACVVKARNLPKQADNGLWQPGDGVSREEWLRCQGMPCSQWNRTQTKLENIRQLELKKIFNSTIADDTNQGQPSSQHIREDTAQFNGTLDGCVWLTEEQADTILRHLTLEEEEAGENQHKRRTKRKVWDVQQYPFLKWPTGPILYKFDGSHDETERDIVRSALSHWEQHTCVRFQEVPTTTYVSDHHIIFTSENTGCHSYIGRITLIPQQVNLKYNCLWSFGIVVHEIAHALGLWHEHQRPDRDDHVIVMYPNLIPAYITSFDIGFETITLGLPYDYSSVMHYGQYSASMYSMVPSLVARETLYQRNMGQRTEASWTDILAMNELYCSEWCPSGLPQACYNGGYQDPNDCSRCKCPDGLTGTYCQDLAPSVNASCGGVLQIWPGMTTSIMSPNYYTTHHYDDRQQCNWLLQAPPGYIVSLEFEDDFRIYCHNQGECFHWVEVKYKSDLSLGGPRFCCSVPPSGAITSEATDMMVLFRSNWTTCDPAFRRGFRASISAIPRNDLGVAAGSITSTTSSTTSTTTSTTTSATTPTTTTQHSSLDSWSWSCDFELNGIATWCEMQQEMIEDDFDWLLKSGATPSANTGPNTAVSGIHYAFIEASSPRNPNDKAILYSPSFQRTGLHCLHFSYHMYGYHIRELQVILRDTEKTSTMWFKSGQMGPDWRSADVSLTLTSTSQVGFVGIRGDEFSGDIAIDNISLTAGNC